MNVVETQRLLVRCLCASDAAFILQLLNEPSWLRYIGDLGFSFLSRFQGNGYAFESASAVMSYGADVLGLSRVVAIVSQDNARSGKLLEKLGFRVERLIRMHADGEALELHGGYPKPAADGFVKPRQTDGQAR